MPKNLTLEDLRLVLEKHSQWIFNNSAGRRANLEGANLKNANLWHANLWHANLEGANLWHANLEGANLEGANLQDANLWLANLKNANLKNANLWHATLNNANLKGANLPHFKIVPDEGSFTAYKKLRNGVIATLKIPAGAARTSCLVGRKCRAEFVKTLALSGNVTNGYSKYDGLRTTYKLGLVTKPNKYDPDIRVECTNGIHFFITLKEAEEYSL